MTIDTEKVASDCVKAINEKIKNLKNLNIIVAGKTGVGKSTLINNVFREKLAETGMGKPVTTHMREDLSWVRIHKRKLCRKLWILSVMDLQQRM